MQCSIVGIKWFRRNGVIQVVCRCERGSHYYKLASEAKVVSGSVEKSAQHSS